jgi:hypothetical protein
VFSNLFYPEQDLAKGLGVVRVQGEAAPEYHLVGAIIDSIVYGTISSVGGGYTKEKNRVDTVMLMQNYPNPFNARTTITYEVQQRGRVSLSVLNILGQVQSTLLEGVLEKGLYKKVWDASNLPSGVYFLRMTLENQSEYQKVVLMR